MKCSIKLFYFHKKLFSDFYHLKYNAKFQLLKNKKKNCFSHIGRTHPNTFFVEVGEG